MDEAHIEHLFTAYLQQTATPEELDAFFAYVESRQHEETLNALLDRHYEKTKAERGMDKADENAIVEAIFAVSEDLAKNGERVNRPHFFNRISLLKKTWMRYAAIFLLLVSAGAYFLFRNEGAESRPGQTRDLVTDIPPGGNRATLTLADGSTILLDSAENGDLGIQGSVQILKLHAGSLAYKPAGERVGDGKILYNTIRTPRGGQYQVVLEDGTKVWLNAESSLRFPTVFDKERAVTVTGEAYFEVAADAGSPFRVRVNAATEIEVLGTAFNVNAYPDEATVNTTLLSGAVRLKVNERFQALTPGIQARVSPDGEIKLVKPDIAGVIAWKNGAFSFNEADLPAVMRQMARWYNVQVEFGGAVPPGRFSGEIGRDLTLSQVLNILTQTRVNYKIEAGRIIILP